MAYSIVEGEGLYNSWGKLVAKFAPRTSASEREDARVVITAFLEDWRGRTDWDEEDFDEFNVYMGLDTLYIDGNEVLVMMNNLQPSDEMSAKDFLDEVQSYWISSPEVYNSDDDSDYDDEEDE